MDTLPARKHPAHCPPVHRHNRPIIILLTVCIRDRRHLLAHPDVHSALRDTWAAGTAWNVGTYVIMPDHIHLFCTPMLAESPGPIMQWTGAWKRLASARCPLLAGQWQRDGWDTQMRNAVHYHRKLEYVRQNPVRKQLVLHAEEWPYSGCIRPLHWVSG